jgi:hypothetical protein
MMLNRLLNRSFFFVILMGALSPGMALAQQNGALPPRSPETLLLEERLNQITREKAQLEQQMKATARVIIPPYREYLLLQKSVRFADLSARLNRLNREGEEVARLLISRGEPIEGRAIQRFNRPLKAFPTFSGAPPLSNMEASGVEESFLYRPLWTPLFRLAIYALLLAIVIFPLAALVEMSRRRRRLAPVIQISSVRRKGPDQAFPKKKAA